MMGRMEALGHQSVAIATGLSLHVVRGGPRNGVPLVLLPAYADSWWSWSRVFPDLTSVRDVLAVDARGHGDSDRPECCYGVDDSAADVVALLETLGIGRAILVGHSGSCFTARRVAATHPHLVAALVLIGSPYALDRQQLAEFVDAVAALADPISESWIRDFQLGAADHPLPSTFVEGIVQESAKVPARVWKATLDGLLEYRDEAALERIAAPTTLIWGDRDAITDREDQERLVAAIGGATLVVLPETGHSVHWERPGRVAEILLEVAAQAD